MVLVDTSVWSLALRRRAVDLSSQEQRITTALFGLVQRREARLLGSIRQEILSGIRDENQFLRVRDHLRGFPNVDVDLFDYEAAARISNECRRQGIVGSSIDMLICAVSLRHTWEVLTTDHDFTHYGRVLPLKMFSVLP